MNTRIEIVQAQLDDAAVLAHLTYAMETELWDGATGGRTEQDYIKTCETLLRKEDGFWALLAKDETGHVMGMMTISQCTAIYAGGYFGEIMEFYVEPLWRSRGCGQLLMTEARAFATGKGWPFLEVGAPSQPRWKKTLDFYHGQGFRDIGPRLELDLER